MRVLSVLFRVALTHLLARKRQTFVSLSGIALGVAFFLAISALMQGSENDAIRRLVDNSPHITLSDEFRAPHLQPLAMIERFEGGAIEIRRVKPPTQTRGIRHYGEILKALSLLEGTIAAPLLDGQALVRFAGKITSVSVSGMVPRDIRLVTTLADYMVEGEIASLIKSSDGIVIGEGMAKELSLSLGDTLVLSTALGNARSFKISGIFRTGRSRYDRTQTFITLKRAQVLFAQPNRVNGIIVKMARSQEAQSLASSLEARFGYKAVSWQEASEDLLNTLAIRNRIMYTVVSAVLIVAAFGIYNVISTVVLEKRRDIAILKSMGFLRRDIQRIFLIQGGVLGSLGCGVGLPLGCLFMVGLGYVRLKPPGGNTVVSLPLDWGWPQFVIAASFAMGSALLAAWLPARAASRLEPVDVLRGS